MEKGAKENIKAEPITLNYGGLCLNGLWFGNQANYVLFICGYKQQAKHLQPIANHLTNTGMLAIELPGTSINSCEAEQSKTTLQQWRSWLDNLTKQFGRPRSIAGYSLGARPAYYLAQQTVTKNTTLIAPDGPRYRFWLHVATGTARPLFAYSLTNNRILHNVVKLWALANPKRKKFIFDNLSPQNLKCVYTAWMAVSDLNKINYPKNENAKTIIIAGKDDNILPIKDIKRTHQLLKKSELLILNGNHFNLLVLNAETIATILKKHC